MANVSRLSVGELTFCCLFCPSLCLSLSECFCLLLSSFIIFGGANLRRLDYDIFNQILSFLSFFLSFMFSLSLCDWPGFYPFVCTPSTVGLCCQRACLYHSLRDLAAPPLSARLLPRRDIHILAFRLQRRSVVHATQPTTHPRQPLSIPHATRALYCCVYHCSELRTECA
jgi:hypothetical protein